MEGDDTAFDASFDAALQRLPLDEPGTHGAGGAGGAWAAFLAAR